MIERDKLKVVCNERAAQQINGRERETTTLLFTLSVKPKVVAGGFAPRHLSR